MSETKLPKGSKGFKPHDLIWDEEKIRRYFNYKRTTNPDSYAGSGTWKYIAHFLRGRLNITGKTILDIGCGSGHLLRQLRDLGGICYGIEISEKSIQDSEEINTTNITVKKATAREIPFPNNQFDIVFATDVMEHILDEDVRKIMLEIQRVIKRDGHLVVLVPYETVEYFRNSQGICPECGAIFNRNQHVRRFDVGTLRSFFEAYGFKAEFIESINSDTVRLTTKRWLARFSRKFRGLPTVPPAFLLYAEFST